MQVGFTLGNGKKGKKKRKGGGLSGGVASVFGGVNVEEEKVVKDVVKEEEEVEEEVEERGYRRRRVKQGGVKTNTARSSKQRVNMQLFAQQVRVEVDAAEAKGVVAGARTKQALRAERVIKKALEEDAKAFAYDEVYDEMAGSTQAGQAAGAAAAAAPKASKYIGSLMEQAKLREREREVIHDRVLLKQRLKEDHMYEGKEKFITSAYKRKLEEDRRWQEAQKAKDAADQQSRDSSKFLGNLLSRRVSEAVEPDPAAVAVAPSAPSALESSEPKPKRRRRVAPATSSSAEAELERVRQERAQAEAAKRAEAAAKLKRRNDDSSVMSARERYLARKRKKQAEAGEAAKSS